MTIVVRERIWEMAERVRRTQIGLLRPNANPNATLSLGSSLDPILQGSGTVDYFVFRLSALNKLGANAAACLAGAARPGRWHVTAADRSGPSSPGSFLVLTMRPACGGLCRRLRTRLRSSTGRIQTSTSITKLPLLHNVHAPGEHMGLTRITAWIPLPFSLRPKT